MRNRCVVAPEVVVIIVEDMTQPGCRGDMFTGPGRGIRQPSHPFHRDLTGSPIETPEVGEDWKKVHQSADLVAAPAGEVHEPSEPRCRPFAYRLL